MYEQGLTLMATDPVAGKAALERAAQAGVAEAALTLGDIARRSDPPDERRATEYFLQAAHRGNRDAQYNVGLAYVRGLGVTADLARAASWFQEAAMQGDAGAQFNLGVMTLNGEGVPADPALAAAWFTLAMEQGYNGATGGRTAAMQHMTSEQARDIETHLQRLRARIHPVASADPT